MGAELLSVDRRFSLAGDDPQLFFLRGTAAPHHLQQLSVRLYFLFLGILKFALPTFIS